VRLFLSRGGGCYALPCLSVSLSFSPRTKDDVDAERGGRCGRKDFRRRRYRVFRRGKRVCACVCVLFWFLGKRSFFQSVSLSLFLFVRVYYIYLYSLSVLVCDRGVRDMVRNEIPPPKRRKRRETTEMSRTTTSTTRRVRVKTTKKSTRKRRNGIKS
jgi:hypothetical protein